jgi:hypothetical protein
MSTTGKKHFDPNNATPEEVNKLYMRYLGAVAFIGDNAPHVIDRPENDEIITQIFEDCLDITGIPYKRTINRFDLRPDRKRFV